VHERVEPEQRRSPANVEEAVELFVRTGEADELSGIWAGRTVVESAQDASDRLLTELVAEVERRAAGVTPIPQPTGLDLVAFTRRRVEPMVRGLFPHAEHDAVLSVLERSVVLLTTANIREVLLKARWLHSAWDLANLYLGSLGAPLLAPDAASIVGLSGETTCYITLDYFRRQGQFEDFVVHEAAHIFHNCKRRTMGLPETRTREWPLALRFVKRELFAFCCEAFRRILEQSGGRSERLALVDVLAGGPMPNDDSVDPEEYVDVLREAAGARNGWKRILHRCS
jgi:hypothetical protein